MDEQQIRFEAVKAVITAVRKHDSAWNLLQEAGWVADWILTGKDPLIDKSASD